LSGGEDGENVKIEKNVLVWKNGARKLLGRYLKRKREVIRN
jgi:hypothetical protein